MFAHPYERDRDTARDCIDSLDGLIATGDVEPLTAQSCHQFHCCEACRRGRLFALGQNQAAYTLPSEIGVCVHGTDLRGIPIRVEQFGVTQTCAVIATIKRRASAPATATCDDAVLLGYKIGSILDELGPNP